MRCPTCGSENRDDANQCTCCGQRLAPKIPSSAPSQNNDQQNSYTWSDGSQPDMNQQQGNWQNQPQGNWQSQGWMQEGQQQNGYWQNGQNGPMYNPYGQQRPPKKTNSLSMVSMILALASIPMLCFFWPISIGMDLAAIITGIIALKKYSDGKPQAIIGIIAGGVIFIACIAMFVMFIYLMNDPQFTEMFNQLYRELYNQTL